MSRSEARAALTRITMGRGMGEYGDLGKLRISFKHPFGKKSIFGKTVRTVGKVAKIAVPLVAGGLALKVGAPLLKKGISSLFRKKSAPSTTVVTSAGPVVTPAADVTATPSVAETVAQTAATLATSALAPSYEIPGAAPVPPAGGEGEAATGGGEVQTMQAGMAGGLNTKTLLILSAVGAGALLLSKRGR
jgi:hypothetical protein